MDWLTLALIAAALNGGVSVVDKFVIEKQIPNPMVYSLFMGSYGIISAIVVFFAADIHIRPVGLTIMAFLSGTAYLLYIVLYFAAMSYNDASVVVALGQISPIFSTLLGFLFLNERFTMLTYLGVGLTTVGAVLISLERNEDTQLKRRLRINAALRLMVVACFIYSLNSFMLKFALEEISVWDGFFWPRMGVFAGALALLLLPSVRRQLSTALRNIGWRVNVLIMGSEGAALVAVYAMTLAFDRGPLTLVSASSATQPIFIMLFVWIVNRIRSDTIPDRTDRRLAIVRLLPLGLIAIGVYLLNR
jgi:transporter family protein